MSQKNKITKLARGQEKCLKDYQDRFFKNYDKALSAYNNDKDLDLGIGDIAVISHFNAMVSVVKDVRGESFGKENGYKKDVRRFLIEAPERAVERSEARKALNKANKKDLKAAELFKNWNKIAGVLNVPSDMKNEFLGFLLRKSIELVHGKKEVDEASLAQMAEGAANYMYKSHKNLSNLIDVLKDNYKDVKDDKIQARFNKLFKVLKIAEIQFQQKTLEKGGLQ